MNLLAQAPLGADAEAIAHDQNPDHQLGVDQMAGPWCCRRRITPASARSSSTNLSIDLSRCPEPPQTGQVDTDTEPEAGLRQDQTGNLSQRHRNGGVSSRTSSTELTRPGRWRSRLIRPLAEFPELRNISGN